MSNKKRKLLASLQKEVIEKDRKIEIKTESIIEPIVKAVNIELTHYRTMPQNVS